MSSDKTGAKNSFQQIRPAPIVLTRADDAQADPAARRLNLPLASLIALIAIILLACMIFTFIVLPGWFAPSSTPPVKTAEAPALPSDHSPQPALTKPDAELPLPWNESQLAEFRKKSQDTLAAMLQAEEQLKKTAVEKWGAEQHLRATAHAEQGDQLYRKKQFKAANAEYEQALTLFNELLAEADNILRLSLEQGRDYLQSGDAEKAAGAFEKALLIEPDNATAAAGLQRTRTLDEVRSLTDQATELLLQGELDKARNILNQALSLDKQDELAKQKLADVRQRSRDRDFNQAMSAGYIALDNNDYAQAAAKFSRALRIKPGTQEALSALDQSKQGMITDNLKKLLLQGHTLETAERWKDAIDVYTEALKLDGNSAEARQKKQAAQRRAMLDQKLTDTIARAERLTDQDVYQESLTLQNEIDKIEVRGPRLTEQKKTLSKLLQQASEPVSVTFFSDDQTDVTLYRVGKLGNFDKTNLQLLPGKYIAVGHRQGYRDVRVEFTVQANDGPQSVDIRSREKIVSVPR